MTDSQPLRSLRRSYHQLATGDRRAVLALLKPYAGGFVYDGQKTLLHAAFALLDWMETLNNLTLEVSDHLDEGTEMLSVEILVSGTGQDTDEIVTFCVSHLWQAGPQGRVRFQWFSKRPA